MSDVRVQDKNRVVSLNRKGEVVAHALRVNSDLPWIVYQGKVFAAHVEPTLPEVVQRKLILAMLEALS